MRAALAFAPLCRCAPAWVMAAVQLGLQRSALQVPHFELFEMRAKVLLTATKAAGMGAFTSLGVLAFNVLGRGGIGDSWQADGLNASTTLFECSTAVPTSCAAGPCSTVWLQSPDCAVLNTSHIRITGKDLQASMAQVHIAAIARSLKEQLYPFVMHLPISNGSSWRHLPIDGELSVRAIADAALSDVQLQNTAPDAAHNTAAAIPAGDELRVNIVARDSDGFVINRSGEMILVTSQGPDGTNHTELAAFDETTGLYSTAVLTRATGVHSLFIEAAGLKTAFRRAMYTVVCAPGRTDSGTACEAADSEQLIVASIIAAVILAVLLVFAFLLWKKRSTVKEFFVSFASLEGLLVAEMCLEIWCGLSAYSISA